MKNSSGKRINEKTKKQWMVEGTKAFKEWWVLYQRKKRRVVEEGKERKKFVELENIVLKNTKVSWFVCYYHIILKTFSNRCRRNWDDEKHYARNSGQICFLRSFGILQKKEILVKWIPEENPQVQRVRKCSRNSSLWKIRLPSGFPYGVKEGKTSALTHGIHCGWCQ